MLSYTELAGSTARHPMGWVPGSRARGWEFNVSLGLLGEEPAWVALGNLHSPKVLPEEGNGKPLLSTLHLKRLFF